MSSILTTKALGIVGGIAGVTAIGGGIAYGSGLFSDSKPEQNEITLISNQKRLENEGFEVLDTEKDSDDWQTVLTAYLEATKGSFTGQKDSARNKDTLRAECRNQLNLSSEASYLLTRKWCVKEQSVADILKKGYTQLDATQAKEEENEAWTANLKALKATQGNKFKDLREKVTPSDANEATLRKECGALNPSTIKTTNEKFADVFEKTRKFCSKKKE